jgi:hypothetical protein
LQPPRQAANARQFFSRPEPLAQNAQDQLTCELIVDGRRGSS